jgi:Ca2+-binding EF-hand superfamily protein
LEHIPEYLGDTFYIPGNPINCLLSYDNNMGVEIDLLRAFKSYRIIKDGVINLKRLRYMMQFFDFDIDEEGIKNNYIVR